MVGWEIYFLFISWDTFLGTPCTMFVFFDLLILTQCDVVCSSCLLTESASQQALLFPLLPHPKNVKDIFYLVKSLTNNTNNPNLFSG